MFKGTLKGYTRNLVRINLTTNKITREKIKKDLLLNYIGGRGLNVKYLYDELKPGTDPLGPDNKIFIGVGPCNGTILSGSQRFNMTSRSPLNGFLCDCNSGGDFGAELKYAGLDMVIIEGQSRQPVYIWINDGNIEIRDASHIWGKDAHESRRQIEIDLGDSDIRVCTIGPPGENLVRFAGLTCELGRMIGRGGMGAIFGSKKVKAIAVRGSKGVTVADYEKFKQLNDQNNKNWQNGLGGKALEWITTSGVTIAWEPMQLYGRLPVKNFQRGAYDKNLLKELREKKYIVKQKSCVSCALGCNMSYVVKNGSYKGAFGEALQLVQLIEGPKMGTDDVDLLLKVGMLTDNNAMDVMDTTALISFVLECGQRGILDSSDVSGLKLEWGNHETILEFIDMIIHRRGIGDVLAEGLLRAPKIIGKGSEKYAMHSKGQVLVSRNPRTSKAWALQYATSSRGACHVRAFSPEGYIPRNDTQGVWPPDCIEKVKDYEDPFNPLLESGKAEIVKYYDELRAFQDSMEVCRFSLFNVLLDAQNKSISDSMAEITSAATGNPITGKDVLHIGERIINLERAFNIREGLTRKDDSLPERMTKEPIPDGPGKGLVVDLEYMLNRYYELRGWNIDTGFPEEWKLRELGLDTVIDAMYNS